MPRIKRIIALVCLYLGGMATIHAAMRDTITAPPAAAGGAAVAPSSILKEYDDAIDGFEKWSEENGSPPTLNDPRGRALIDRISSVGHSMDWLLYNNKINVKFIIDNKICSKIGKVSNAYVMQGVEKSINRFLPLEKRLELTKAYIRINTGKYQNELARLSPFEFGCIRNVLALSAKTLSAPQFDKLSKDKDFKRKLKLLRDQSRLAYIRFFEIAFKDRTVGDPYLTVMMNELASSASILSSIFQLDERKKLLNELLAYKSWVYFKLKPQAEEIFEAFGSDRCAGWCLFDTGQIQNDASLLDQNKSTGGKMHGINYIGFLPLLIVWVALAVPVMIILKRVGKSRWWVITSFVPLINIVFLWIFAFSRWPALDDKGAEENTKPPREGRIEPTV